MTPDNHFERRAAAASQEAEGSTPGAGKPANDQTGETQKSRKPKSQGNRGGQKAAAPAQGAAGGNGQGQNQSQGQGQPRKGKKPNRSSQNNSNGQNNQNGQNGSTAKGQNVPNMAVAPASLAGRKSAPVVPLTGQSLKIIPLGGLGEIGKNMTAYECGNDIFIVDCGLAFPDEDLLGVDLVIPDFTFLERNRDRLRGVVLTHGHEDHIGALPYLLKSIHVPLYGTRLTLGLVEGKLKEHGLLGQVALNVTMPGDVVKLGCMAVEFIHVNHSIPDACALAIHTPVGVVIQTGDFKVDYTPIQGPPIDLARFGELGSQGVLALLSDSTNAERPGSTLSERTVGESFEKLFKSAFPRRIIIATFSSNIHRVQQIIDCSARSGRKVAVSGRSMINVVAKAMELGYLTVPEGVMIDIDAMDRYPEEQIVIVTTGSQGEPMSALTRMAMSDHRKVQVTPNDFIIISATPIPGNEKMVGKVINELMKLGSEVVYEKMYEVHVSGHACQDELRQILALTKPKFFIPVHGEFKHIKKHADLARSMGIAPRNIFLAEIGRMIETDGEKMQFTGAVPAGRVLVDGLGVGDVGSIVLRDRKHLGQDGLIVVVTTIDPDSGEVLAGPDLVSRGFVYVREAEDMMNEARDVAKASMERCKSDGMKDWGSIKQKVRDELSDFLYARTKRSPMILPIIQEVER